MEMLGKIVGKLGPLCTEREAIPGIGNEDCSEMRQDALESHRIFGGTQSGLWSGPR